MKIFNFLCLILLFLLIIFGETLLAKEDMYCDYVPQEEFVEEYTFNDYPRPIELPLIPGYTYVRVSTSGSVSGLVKIQGKWVESKTAYHLNGVGVVVASGYVVTVAHVVEPYIACFPTGIGERYCTKVLKVNTKQIFVGDELNTGASDTDDIAELVYLDVKNDLALLKVPKVSFIPIPYKIKSSIWECYNCFEDLGGLQKGDAVAVVTRTRDKNEKWDGGFEVIYGKVVSPTIKTVKGKTHTVTFFSPMTFTIDIKSCAGDSGNPVFAFMMDKPVFVGVVVAIDKPPPYSKCGRTYTYVTRVNFITRLEHIFN